MRIVSRAVVLGIVLCFTLVTCNVGFGVPQTPHQFYGEVRINDSPASDGTEIEAYIDDVLYGATVVSEGVYGYDPLFYVTADDPDTGDVEGGVSGDTVEFFVDGVYVDSVSFSVGGVTEYDLDFSSHNVQLYSGWNLVAFPVLPDDSAVENVFDQVMDVLNSIWTYDGVSDSWSSYSPGAPSSISSLVISQGYWVNVDDDRTLTIYGSGGSSTVNVETLPLDGKTVEIGYISSTTAGLDTVFPLVEIIETDLNAYADKLGYDVSFDFIVEDAEGVAATHLEKVEGFKSMDINLFIGGGWSSQAYGSLDYCNDNDMLMVSSSSTSPLLAIPNDNLYRLCPDDTVQATAIAEMLDSHGVEAVIVLQRGDSWADGIYGYLEPAYTDKGGVILQRIRYAGEATEFSSYLQTAEDVAATAITTYGAEHVGVELLSFAEFVTIITQAEDYPNLYSLTWFGSDGTTLSQQACDDAPEQVTHLRVHSTYAAPVDSEKYNELYDRYYASITQPLGYYSACAYDAAWLLAEAVLETQSTDATDVIPVFSDLAENRFGASGWTQLNDAGDRKATNYQIWSYRYEDSICVPYVSGLYDSLTDEVTWDTDEMGYTPPS